MTYEQAVKLRREILKNAIRARLHKMNPDKYPKPPTRIINAADIVTIWEAAAIITFHDGVHPFDRDDVFFKHLRNK